MKMYKEITDEETSDVETSTTTKRFEGFDARFGTDPEEIYIELRMGSPAYIHLREGDYLQEGDAFHREQLGMASPTLDTWEVVDVTPDSVVGRDIDTGEEVTLAREEVEKGLAVGKYSTNLTDFEWVSVYQVGEWAEYDPEDEDSGTQYTGRPYVSVVAYGDNGLKYGRRYRFVAPESNELSLRKADEPRGGFSEAVAERLDQRVHAALEADGYFVAEPEVAQKRGMNASSFQSAEVEHIPQWDDPERCPFCGRRLADAGAGFIEHVAESPVCEDAFDQWRDRIASDIAGEWIG